MSASPPNKKARLNESEDMSSSSSSSSSSRDRKKGKYNITIKYGSLTPKEREQRANERVERIRQQGMEERALRYADILVGMKHDPITEIPPELTKKEMAKIMKREKDRERKEQKRQALKEEHELRQEHANAIQILASLKDAKGGSKTKKNRGKTRSRRSRRRSYD